MRPVWALAILFPVLALAQGQTDETITPKFDKAPEGVIYDDSYVEETIEVERPVSRSEERPVALLRGLDKISGRVSDIRAVVGNPVQYERLTITVSECREPPADEPTDAFVLMTIADSKLDGAIVFSGWMFASSPALSAMDHQRYDVWTLSCATS